MINYSLKPIVTFVGLLEQERRIAGEKVRVFAEVMTGNPRDGVPVQKDRYAISPTDRKRIENMLSLGGMVAKQLHLPRTEDRLQRLKLELGSESESPMNVQNQLQAVHEALRDDVQNLRFYSYPDKKAEMLLTVDAAWARAFAKFPSIRSDARAATDSFALEHHKGCVFYCMTILQTGLKALAAAVALPHDAQEWNRILDNLERAISQPHASDSAADARTPFNADTARELRWFRNTWRDFAAHLAVEYDENQTLATLERTRTFMNHLANELLAHGAPVSSPS